MPEPTTPRPLLPEGYYAENVALVLETVAERYGDLLNPAERGFLESFRALSLGARRLFVRLTSRVGPVFRLDLLHYPEIPDLAAAIRELIAAGLLDRAEDAPLEDLAGLLRRPEILELLAEHGARPDSGTRKEALLAALLETIEPTALRDWLETRCGLLRPLAQEQVLVFRLLFFGNLSQDWTEFVLRDLGVVRYELYELRRELRLFPTRQALDDSLFLRQLRQNIALALEAGETEPALEIAEHVRIHVERWHPTTRRHADRVLHAGAQTRERRGELTEALALYHVAHAPPARERRARILDKLGQHREALELCTEIAAGPRDETEAVFAPVFAAKLRRKLGETHPHGRRARPRIRELIVERHPGVAVETLALEALSAEGRIGFFAENWLWRSLFGLAFWDVVFAPIAGAFEHPFQLGPLDLHSPEFRRARAEAIDARLAELHAESALDRRLLTVYAAKHGTANALVAWQDELRPALELALGRLEGRHLAAVCDRLSRDLQRYRRGLPDLFVVRPEPPGFELLEVKAPGDQLRPEQGAWLDYLEANGLPAAILKLRWR